MRIILVSLLLLLVSTSTAFAQCVIGTTSPSSESSAQSTIGNSFTATCSGVIEKVSLKVWSGQSVVNGTLNIYSGESVANGDLLYTQSGVNIDSSSYEITLTTPEAVTSENKYTMTVTDTGTFKGVYSASNPYSGGNAYTNGTGFVSNSDFNFTVTVAAVSSAPAASLIGYILMGVGLLCSGFYTIRRKKLI